jgi:hypothetical protein
MSKVRRLDLAIVAEGRDNFAGALRDLASDIEAGRNHDNAFMEYADYTMDYTVTACGDVHEDNHDARVADID